MLFLIQIYILCVCIYQPLIIYIFIYIQQRIQRALNSLVIINRKCLSSGITSCEEIWHSSTFTESSCHHGPLSFHNAFIEYLNKSLHNACYHSIQVTLSQHKSCWESCSTCSITGQILAPSTSQCQGKSSVYYQDASRQKKLET